MLRTIATAVGLIVGLVAIGTSIWKIAELKRENIVLKDKMKEYEKIRDDYSKLVIEIISNGKVSFNSISSLLPVKEVETIRNQLPKCRDLNFDSPPIKIHFFNGTRLMAEKAANQTSIPITNDPRNVIGTKENSPVYSINLTSNSPPNEGIIKIAGTYEIHADDFGGGMPYAYISTFSQNGNETKIPIKLRKVLKAPTDFSVDINYRTNEIIKMEMHVQSAGSWGFFLDNMAANLCY